MPQYVQRSNLSVTFTELNRISQMIAKIHGYFAPFLVDCIVREKLVIFVFPWALDFDALH